MSLMRTGLAQMKTWIDGWSVLAMSIAALVLLPIVSVVILALTPSEPVWAHLWSTTLPRYISNTLILMVGVGVATAIIGTVTAWLIAMYRFPMSRWLEWMLLLPLAMPAYVAAYALVDFMEYAGPLQSVMRDVFGWENSQDYWFPEIRSRGSAIFVLSGSLFPYVYLLARASFRERGAAMFDTARALGAGGTSRFWKIAVPLARPAIFAGVAIVMMETVNDFGTVDYFAVQTLTTGIFSIWLEGGNASGAAQIATCILMVIVVLVFWEKVSRRKNRFFETARQQRPIVPQALPKTKARLAFLACALPVIFGFFFPLGVLSYHAVLNYRSVFDDALIASFWNSLLVSGSAAIVTVFLAVLLVYAVRLKGRRLPTILLPFTTIGYATPGAVLALGLLVPVAAFDNALADRILAVTGIDPGLMLTGGIGILVLAYTVRFFAIAQGAADAALGRISPNLPLASRSLGHGPLNTLKRVLAPLMRPSIGAALLLVFVDSIKELPATLLLRPFNFETLATRVHQQASLENLGNAAPGALLITFVSLGAIVFLAKNQK